MFGILTSEVEHRRVRRGTTITELMATMLILAFVMAALMPFVVTIMRIREDERESAYIRERLADVSAILADFISMGASFTRSEGSVDFNFRMETGGVSLETGTVSQVTHLLTSSAESDGSEVDIVAIQTKFGVPREVYGRRLRGEDVGFTVFTIDENEDTNEIHYVKNDIHYEFKPFARSELGELEVSQRYRFSEESPWRTVSVSRIVRLWNAEAAK